MLTMLVRALIFFSIVVSVSVSAGATDDSLGGALKKIFASPTPTPRPKKKKTTSSNKKSPTPTPAPKKSPTPREKEPPSPSPKKKRTPSKAEESPTPAPKKKRTPAEEGESPSPTPKKKHSPPAEEETSTPKKKKSSVTTPTESPHHKRKASPSPEPLETPEISPSATPSPLANETPKQTPAPTEKHRAPNATVATDQIRGFDSYPEKVQKVLTAALELTTRGLTYKYGSDDPDTGGMDCSGFVYFVLRQNGFKDVPRDSTEQYNWLRRIHAFEPVLSERDDSYELDELRPGDLLFWTGTYSVQRDPPITHTMIYIGREKKTGNRIMVGSSDGRVYQGESRNGVSVFDFNVHRSKANLAGDLHPVFVGYGHIPGIQE